MYAGTMCKQVFLTFHPPAAAAAAAPAAAVAGAGS